MTGLGSGWACLPTVISLFILQPGSTLKSCAKAPGKAQSASRHATDTRCCRPFIVPNDSADNREVADRSEEHILAS